MANVAPGIDLLPSGRFRWRIVVDGIPYRGICDTLAKARQARLDAKHAAGATIRPDKLTVLELVDTWAADTKHARSTVEAREYALGKVPRRFLDQPAAEVTPPVVASLWREMRQTISPHIIAEARKALSAAFQVGVEWGVVESNPVIAVRFSTPKAAEVTPPTPEQVAKIVTYFANPRPARNPGKFKSRKQPLPAVPAMAAWCQVMATIGTRPGECCALRWDELDVQDRKIRISHTISKGEITEGKIGRQGWRTVKLGDDTIAMIRAVPRIVGVPWIFNDGLEPWAVPYVRQVFRRACDDLGIVGVHPYALRHYAATRALAAGRPLTEVAKMLGDNPATVSRTYAHWISESVDEAVLSNTDELVAAKRRLAAR